MQPTSFSHILLYTGIGADPVCARQTKRKLHSLINDKQHKITEIKSLDRVISHLGNTILLCIPGGDAGGLIFHNSDTLAKGNFRALLKKFNVRYWGICSGAIFASNDMLSREKNSFFESKFPVPFLNLYPGQCIAPLYTTKKPEACSFLLNTGERAYSINYDGPGFLVNPEDPNTTVLSTYQNMPEFTLMRNPERIAPYELFKSAVRKPLPGNTLAAEILYQPPGSPPVYLSGIHLEMDAEFTASSEFGDLGALRGQATLRELETFGESEQNHLVTQLRQDGLNQDEILIRRLQMLNISCKPDLSRE